MDPDDRHTADTSETVDTIESWAAAYILSESLAVKLDPPPAPTTFANHPEPLRLTAPGRPAEFTVVDRAPKQGGLRNPRARAQLLHTFLHHELQAAELMCWAVLAFPETPTEFREGLLSVCRDEVRHMQMYRAHIEALGAHVGAFAVRDWFWSRVPKAKNAAEFVAVMGMGFEGANLEHTERFARRFRDVGDEEGARVQERVGREEIAHVAFAQRWFREFTGTDDFDTWVAHLPPPISPILI